jgi:hypoxanthine phosphoribosyltransferase
VFKLRGGTTSSGLVQNRRDLEKPIEGRHVILVEDIIDTGLTLLEIKHLLLQRKPASLSISVLLDKISQRKHDIVADYVGFTLQGSPFVVGYGLDYAGKYRNMAHIGVLSPAVYSH